MLPSNKTLKRRRALQKGKVKETPCQEKEMIVFATIKQDVDETSKTRVKQDVSETLKTRVKQDVGETSKTRVEQDVSETSKTHVKLDISETSEPMSNQTSARCRKLEKRKKDKR